MDVTIPFSRGMASLVQARIAPRTAHQAMRGAQRYGGGDAAAVGIVDQAVAEAPPQTSPVRCRASSEAERTT